MKTKTTLLTIFIVFNIFLFFILARLFFELKYCTSPQSVNISLLEYYYMAGVGSFIAASAAFVGVYLTYRNQRKQNKNQQDNFEKQLAKAEETLNHQKLANERQVKEDNIRRFENTFFHMVSLHEQIVTSLSYKYQYKDWLEEFNGKPTNTRKQILIDEIYNGRDVFKYLYSKININLTETKNNIRVVKSKVNGIEGVLKEEGFRVYNKITFASYFDHYFRQLYSIIKFTHTSECLTAEEKYRYVSMVRSTLSRYELILLFYNGLSDYGNKKFKPLIEEYCLLKNIRKEYLAKNKELVKLIEENKTLNKKFPSNPFEYFTTYEKNVITKYYLGAFYRGNELSNKIREYQRMENI